MHSVVPTILLNQFIWIGKLFSELAGNDEMLPLSGNFGGYD